MKNSVTGPLSSYDEILLDILYSKSSNSQSSTAHFYTDPNTEKKYCVKGNHLDGNSTIISRIDSTLLNRNIYTLVWATSNSGDMAYSDGGFTRNDIAIAKAWYFADSNIPDLWKYCNGNVGIFKYKKSGNIIKKKFN